MARTANQGTCRPADDNVEIARLTAPGARRLAAGMSQIEPWTRLGYNEGQLRDALAMHGPDAKAYEARVAGVAQGVVTYRDGWLFGPYIRLLAVLPPAQGHGLGRRLIDQVVDDSRARGARNIWVCASAFNARALAFYESYGFAAVGTLDGLVVADEAEVLLRLRLDTVTA